ncbi:glycosyltransferase [Candidatus Omnitrophota bacterium]
MLKNRDIICISTSDWAKPWGSKQSLMLKLSEFNRVLYVEYQSSFSDIVKYPGYFFGRLGKINKLRRINDNLYVYTPILLFPFGYYSLFINRINQRLLRIMLFGLLKRLRFRDFILWIYPPCSSYLIDRMGEAATVYHCIAAFAKEKKSYLRKKTINTLERRLVRKSQWILALTKELYKTFKQYNRNTFYFPSAVDMEYFEKVKNMDVAEPEDISFIKKPRIGVIGYLDSSILDMELLNCVARANKEWSIVMVGPVFRNAKSLYKLKENKNVYFIGEKNPQSIPLCIKYLDICLIPYLKNEFSEQVSSLKLYEYLAMGKPVVSTYFSKELDEYKSVIGMAESNERFVELIRKFLIKDEREDINRRVELARKNSWQRRLDFLFSKSEKITEEKL